MTLNLRKILSGDTVGEIIEKANYNFDQLILNGGGPMGSTGNPGRPGIPGRIGPTGSTGYTGASGTYIYTGLTSPNSLTSFVPASRQYDIYMKTSATNLEVWINGTTGATGGWVLSGTISFPNGWFLPGIDTSVTPNRKLVYNDPILFDKFLVGEKTSVQTLGYIFSGTGSTATFISQFEESSSGIEWLSMFAGKKNQIRVLNTETSLMTGLTTSDRNINAGGVMMSLELKSGATVSQVLLISNADTGSNKDFLLNLNSTLSPSLYIDNSNRLQIGGLAYSTLYDKAKVVGSLVIGSTSGATQSIHTVSNYSLAVEGRISVGTYKIDTQSRVFTYGSTFSSIRVDSNFSVGGVSEIHLSQGYVQGSSTKPDWRIHLGMLGITGSTTDKGFRIRGSHDGAYNSTSSLFIGLTSGSTWTRIGIENDNPIATLEVGGSSVGRFGVGQIAYASSTSEKGSGYWAFNLFRERGGTAAVWTRRQESGDNSSALAWLGNNGALGIAVLANTGATVTYSGDTSLLENTQFYFVSGTGSRGKMSINSKYSLGTAADYAPSLVIGATTTALYNFGTQSYGVGLYGNDSVIEFIHIKEESGNYPNQSYATRMIGLTSSSLDGSTVSFFKIEHRGASHTDWKTSLMFRVSGLTSTSADKIGYVGIGTTGTYYEWISGATVSKYGPQEKLHVEGNIRLSGDILLNPIGYTGFSTIKMRDASRIFNTQSLTGTDLKILGSGATSQTSFAKAGKGGNLYIDSGIGGLWYYLVADNPGNTSMAWTEKGNIYLLWDGLTASDFNGVSGRVAIGMTSAPLARLDIQAPGSYTFPTLNTDFSGLGASFHAFIIREGAGATMLSIDKYGRVDSGVAFSPVSSNMSDVNTLDDYEEGSMLMSFYRSVGTRGNTGTAVVNSGCTGYYTKIGDTVTFTVSATIGSLSGGETAGILELGDLPYYSAYDTAFSIYAENFQKPGGESNVVLQAKVFQKPGVVLPGTGFHKGKRIAISAYNPTDGTSLADSSTAEILLENATFIISGTYKASWT